MIGDFSEIRAMLGDFKDLLTLPGGAVVPCAQSVATANQDLGGESTVAGRSTTVRICAGDSADLEEGQTVTLLGKARKVLEIQRVAGGRVLRLTLGGEA